MLDFVRRAYASITYSPETDPKIIPAKLELEGLGTIDYLCSVKSVDGKLTRIHADDPTRTFRFVRADVAQPLRDPESVMSKAAAVFASVWFTGQGAMMGACLAAGVWPIALGLGLITLATLCVFAAYPSADAPKSQSNTVNLQHQVEAFA